MVLDDVEMGHDAHLYRYLLCRRLYLHSHMASGHHLSHMMLKAFRMMRESGIEILHASVFCNTILIGSKGHRPSTFPCTPHLDAPLRSHLFLFWTLDCVITEKVGCRCQANTRALGLI